MLSLPCCCPLCDGSTAKIWCQLPFDLHGAGARIDACTDSGDGICRVAEAADKRGVSPRMFPTVLSSFRRMLLAGAAEGFPAPRVLLVNSIDDHFMSVVLVISALSLRLRPTDARAGNATLTEATEGSASPEAHLAPADIEDLARVLLPLFLDHATRTFPAEARKLDETTLLHGKSVSSLPTLPPALCSDSVWRPAQVQAAASLRAALSPTEALLAGTAYPKARSMKRKIIYHAGEGVLILPICTICCMDAVAAVDRKIRYAARCVFTAGPTNSGKTHTALQRLQGAKSGVYCGPLRLLAMEARAGRFRTLRLC